MMGDMSCQIGTQHLLLIENSLQLQLNLAVRCDKMCDNLLKNTIARVIHKQ